MTTKKKSTKASRGDAALFGTVGAVILASTLAVIAAILIADISMVAFAGRSYERVGSWFSGARERRRLRRELATFDDDEDFEDDDVDEDVEAVAADLDDVEDDEPTTRRSPIHATLRSLFRVGPRRARREALGEDELPALDFDDDDADPDSDTDRRPLTGDPAWVLELGGTTDLVSGALPVADADTGQSASVDGNWDAIESHVTGQHRVVTAEVQTLTPAEKAPRKRPSKATSEHTANTREVKTGEVVEFGPRIVESAAQLQRKRSADLDRAQQQRLQIGDTSAWELPPLSFLSYDEDQESRVDRELLRENALQLEKTLGDFKIKGSVTNICPGPVITMYEFEPEPGTKVSKIAGLSDDIAMALRAKSIRIIAPIPGKGCVGIEVPNKKREIVFLKEILADDKFAKHKSKLAMGLGKDTEGFPVVADLAKMPHLLVAGTTGSGKSVSVNGMITSLLYRTSPDECRMIMIDPKQLEFAIYEDVPHLLLPVVTEPAKAATALQWAVNEMERRYKLMSEMKVRKITAYNQKLRKLEDEVNERAHHADAEYQPDDIELMLAEMDPDGRHKHRHMPFIVVVIDEFADLMMVAGKEVEVSVARLAQKARAAGIHVILATQRPSVDVLTGLIKANFPTRMSFRLISGTDSRTVLDSTGAEALLGMGDMLYRPPGQSQLTRCHGAFVDEAEIEQIVEFLKKQRRPDYDETILQASDEEKEFDDEPVDELYDQAVAAVCEAGYASISMVQRKLRIGYNRSARMVEHMEREGVIGPATGGSSRREVLAGAIPAPI